MMPGFSSHGDPINYKRKYTALKRKLKLLVYEQECFVEELKKAQRKLLKVTRDRSFLLDRLCQYEKTEDTSSDSESTATSDSDNDGGGKDIMSGRKRKGQQASLMQQQQMSLPASSLLGSVGYSAMLAAAQVAQAQAAGAMTSGAGVSSGKGAKEPPKKKQKVTKKVTKATKQSDLAQLAAVAGKKSPVAGQASGHMTREELERHLEMKTSAKPQFMSIDKAPHSLPDDIFSHDNSNPDGSELLERIKSEEETELIIDVPQ